MPLPTVVRRWAYTGALVGAGVSIAANVLHSYVPPEGMPINWQPATGAVVGAVFWPVALLIVVELFARWHPVELRFKALRWIGLVPVAVVAAVVSYRHMSGLLAWWHEDPVTVVIGPLAVDGIMVMAAGALIATSPNVEVKPQAEPVAEPVVDPGEPSPPVVVDPSPPLPATGPALPAAAEVEVEVAKRRARPRRATTGDAVPNDTAARVAALRADRPYLGQKTAADELGVSTRTVARYWHTPTPPANTPPNGRVPHAT